MNSPKFDGSAKSLLNEIFKIDIGAIFLDLGTKIVFKPSKKLPVWYASAQSCMLFLYPATIDF